MSLESIPLEILLEIADPESGIRLSALASLSAVNHLFHAVLTPCLYKRGAEISNKATWGFPNQLRGLFGITRHDNIEIVDLLLKNGAWRDFVDDQYAAGVLHKAVGERGYNLEAQLRLLLDYGDNVNAKDQHGVTALHLATSRKRTATVRILLRYGADMNLEDNGVVADRIPISPVIIASQQDSDVILRVFKEHELWLESLSC